MRKRTLAISSIVAVAVIVGTLGFGLVLIPPWHRANAALSSHSPANPGHLISVASFHDFGTVIPGEVLHHDFWVKNISNQSLRISLGPPSCGCTVANLRNAEIDPGERSVVQVTVSSDEASGHITATVPLIASVVSPQRAGNTEEDAVILHVTAATDDQLGFHPGSIDFGEVRRGEPPAIRKVALTVKQGWSLADVKWLYDTPYSEATWGTPTINPSRTTVYPVVLAFDANRVTGPPMPLAAFGRFRLVHGEVSRVIEIRVSGTVVDDIAASPRSIFWNRSELGSRVTVTISSANGEPLDIVGVKAESRLIGCTPVIPASANPGLVVSFAHENINREIVRTKVIASVRLRRSGEQRQVEIPVLIY